MTRKPTPGRGKKPEPEPVSRRGLPPPPAGLPVMPRPFAVDDLRDDSATVDVTATTAERAELAKAFDIPAVGAVSATFKLQRHGRTVYVKGKLRAQVTQICVVSLDPFDSAITEDIEMRYAPPSDVAAAWAQIAREEANGNSPPPVDPPDQIVDGAIDLGALTAEVLSLSLDPYPKKPGVEFEAPAEVEGESHKDSPFASLSRLRDAGKE